MAPASRGLFSASRRKPERATERLCLKFPPVAQAAHDYLLPGSRGIGLDEEGLPLPPAKMRRGDDFIAAKFSWSGAMALRYSSICSGCIAGLDCILITFP